MTVPPGPAREPGVAIPQCYRHPGRETYVSCSRCGRPACPDCLRSAAVGHHCVDCIRDANRGVRRPAGMFGGPVARTAVVTWTLVGINVAAYLAEWITSATYLNGEELGAARTASGQLIGIAFGQPYRLLTGAFLHEPGLTGFGPLHILFNMWALIVVGPAIERLLGRSRFLAVYLVSALGGAALYYLIGPPYVPALGASGAIFGLFGAWFVVARRLRLDSRQIIGLIVINLVITFVVPGIAWQDHVGGLVCGAALTAAYVYAPRASRAIVQTAATLVLLAIIAGIVVARDYSLVHAVRL